MKHKKLVGNMNVFVDQYFNVCGQFHLSFPNDMSPEDILNELKVIKETRHPEESDYFVSYTDLFETATDTGDELCFTNNKGDIIEV